MKKRLKNKRGITLIALVITIIILIILAGISINLVLGDNGIITKAKESKRMQNEASAKEKLEMILAEYAIEDEFDAKTLFEFLEEKVKEDKIKEVFDNGDGTLKVIVDGYEITVEIETLEIIEIVKSNGIIIRVKNIFWTKAASEGVNINGIVSSENGTIESVMIRKPDGSAEDITESISESGEFSYTGILEGEYKIEITDSSNVSRTKSVYIQEDTEAPEDFTATVTADGYAIKIQASTIDKKSGLDFLEYKIVDNIGNGSVVASGSFTEETITIKDWNSTCPFGNYAVYVTAFDRVGNCKESERVFVTIIPEFNSERDVPIYGFDESAVTGFEGWWGSNSSASVSTENGLLRMQKVWKDTSSTSGHLAGILTKELVNCTGFKYVCFLYSEGYKATNYISLNITKDMTVGLAGIYSPVTGYSDDKVRVRNQENQMIEVWSLKNYQDWYRVGLMSGRSSFDVKFKQIWLEKD